MWACLALAGLLSGTAQAASVKIAVMPMKAQRVEQTTVTILDDLLAARVDLLGKYSVIMPDDIAFVLNLDALKTTLDCSSATCMAELSGALGVEELVRGTVSQLGSKLILNLVRLKTRDAEIINRAIVKVELDENLYDDALGQAVAQLFPGKKGSPATGASTAKSTGSITTIESSSLPEISTTVWVFWGVGAVATGLGTYFGLESKRLEESGNAQGYGQQVIIQDAQRKALLTNISFGVAGASLATGLLLWILDDDAPPGVSQAGLTPFFDQRSVGIMFQGELP
jgi:hypothetical protein